MSFGRSILIVDDDPKLRFTLAIILRRADYQIAAVSCAEDALHSLQVCHFDLIILDLSIPDLHGLQFMPLLTKLYPALPIVVLTGDDSLDTTIASLRLGARGYLLKPIKPDQILACLTEILKENTSIPKPSYRGYVPRRPVKKARRSQQVYD